VRLSAHRRHGRRFFGAAPRCVGSTAGGRGASPIRHRHAHRAERLSSPALSSSAVRKRLSAKPSLSRQASAGRFRRRTFPRRYPALASGRFAAPTCLTLRRPCAGRGPSRTRGHPPADRVKREAGMGPCLRRGDGAERHPGANPLPSGEGYAGLRPRDCRRGASRSCLTGSPSRPAPVTLIPAPPSRKQAALPCPRGRRYCALSPGSRGTPPPGPPRRAAVRRWRRLRPRTARG